MPGCSTRAVLQLVGPTSWTEVRAVLAYDAADPYAVRIRFGGRASRPGVDERRTRHPAAAGLGSGDTGGEDDGVEWMVARDLLHAGLSHPAGDGDVRLWPARTAGDVLFLELRAPSGHALFELSRAVLAGFVADSERLVPIGREADALDVDHELQALLQGEGPETGGR
ncbi:SsgA family sporulation/cell division regulator [Klenkia taihuensis]|uniref:Streptomyces sporulation and cell division protein, SsgA n=1 Tax=Klenkia taihuensis TaxID=1225127 RepID=A0A1I1TB13_9ACTN|nr:SsgA family sporulation/cell division regulator [Klenkia taihuensis]SFD54308.1 Streptomyces sporulation and cell division protein, SsgA [Klenkia taihuensis]